MSWKVREDQNCVDIVDEQGGVIAVCGDYIDMDDKISNLIASAPDLLEVCKRVEEHLSGEYPTVEGIEEDELIQDLRTIITKAEGE